MSWVITGSQPFPAVIGEAFGGGYFAGYISHTADGSPTHALIVAPRATGATGTGYTLTTGLQWKTSQTLTTGTSSDFDGAANTAAMNTAGINDHPAAKFCTELTIGGFTDWYLPSRYELEISYFLLKPTVQENAIFTISNPYAVPSRGAIYTPKYPAQTYVTPFASATEQFEADYHWSSTDGVAVRPWGMQFNNGNLNSASGLLNKTVTSVRTRAFRRIAL
jgi:hypothetical protein